MFNVKLKNLFIVFCVLLSLFANVGICYADMISFPTQFMNAMEEAIKENIGLDGYIEKKANELGISAEEYKKYLWYNKYDKRHYYTFDDSLEEINGGFTYQEYEKYVQKDNIRLGLSIIGVSLFVIFWIFILVMIVKKIKKRKLVEVSDNKESSNGLGVEK